MKKKKEKDAYLPFCLLLPFVFAAISYWVSESWAFFGLVALSYLLLFLFFVQPLLHAYQEKKRKRRECYRFCCSFITGLSLTGSLEKSYEAALSDVKGPLKEVADSLEERDVRSRLFYLESYFEQDSYPMFLSLFSLYEEQGGSLLFLSKGLLDEMTRVEETGREIELESRKNLRQFFALWLMALGILAFLRIGLANFYDSLTHSPFYLGGCAVFFLFFAFSLALYFYVYAGKPPLGKKKGAEQEEKNEKAL